MDPWHLLKERAPARVEAIEVEENPLIHLENLIVMMENLGSWISAVQEWSWISLLLSATQMWLEKIQ
jgi:hypothetical protein